MGVTDSHNKTLAVNVTLNLSTTHQIKPEAYIVENGWIAGFQYFFFFPTMVSKSFFIRVVKNGIMW